MNDADYDAIDETIIETFEAAWLDGNPSEIEQIIADVDSERRAGTLEELVHIDLEFRWKLAGSQAKTIPPTVNDYLQRFSQLRPVMLDLVLAEFELAHRFGLNPSIDEVVDRYREEIAESELRPSLAKLNPKPEPSKLTAGAKIDRYELVTEHGRGGFGAVWRATDTKLGRRIAVKQLGQRLARDHESRRRFISEARITAKLEHPGIVPVYDMSGVDDTHAYYTMRLIQGETMAEAIERLYAIPRNTPEFEMRWQRLLRAFVDVCETIQYAHSRGVIHRDLKPQNVVLGDFGETILLDWGLASRLDAAAQAAAGEAELSKDDSILSPEESLQTLKGTISGTPAYMSPEQASGQLESIDERSDQYALGAMLYQITTGKVPFDGDQLDDLLDRVKRGDCPAPHEVRSSTPRALAAITSKAMSVAADERYPSVAEFTRDVQRYQADQAVSVYRDPIRVQMFRWLRKHPTAATALLLLTVFSVVGLGSGVYLRNAWQLRERDRLEELRVAAEKAETSALGQIASGRFVAAERTLDQAMNLIETESKLGELLERLEVRHKRTTKIVQFYELSSKAQEATFFDEIYRSALYCQASLKQLDVFEHADWWSHLPDEDLTERQQLELRTEVYRILGLLASMRLAESAEEQFTLAIFFRGLQPDDLEGAGRPLLAADLAADLGQNYRPSRAMQIVSDLRAWLVDGAQNDLLKDVAPTNPTDAAIMGSILDNNRPQDAMTKALMRGVLKGREAGDAAQAWLNESLQASPDWYWLAVFMGTSELREGDYESSLKAYTHAIGIQPDHWVGYQYRAVANVLAARNQEDQSDRQSYITAAHRDLQRAFDLTQVESDPFWTQALILSETQADPARTINAFLRALSRHKRLDQIRNEHYSAISQFWFAEAQQYVDYLEANDLIARELVDLKLALAIWSGDEEVARQLSSSLDPTVVTVNAMTLGHLASALRGELEESSAAELAEMGPQSEFHWATGIELATYYRKSGSDSLSEETLTELEGLNVSDWQRALTHLHIAELALEREDFQLATDHYAAAVTADLSVNDEPLREAAVARIGNQEAGRPLVERINQHREEIRPITELMVASIQRPAITNAGFELGLATGWLDGMPGQQQSGWDQQGGSQATAEVTSDDRHVGERSLQIKGDETQAPGRYASVRQRVPVTPGENYQLSFWARGEKLETGSLQVMLGDEPSQIAVLEPGDSDWKRYETEIQATEKSLQIEIRSQGSGTAWIDEFQLERQ